nr:lytic murein transglycosylase [Amycolatopsis nigrescens]
MAVIGGTLAVVPAVAASGGAATWVNLASSEHTGDAALEGGFDPRLTQIGVNGSLPQAPAPVPLGAYELPSGPLGIPGTALKAYQNAAEIVAREQPGSHIDWALIASIGRIESNHARGGYVDAKGDTLEPILGPVLNGAGPVAAIADSDGGRFDADPVWDRAVGPTQFIPSTWRNYASDGNGDGESNPNNIYDATLGTGRYLTSGGLDLANPDQLRAAIFRYNNSDSYVNTVILWAQAYRSGSVGALPDSKVPIGAPNTTTSPAPGEVPPPPAPTTTPTTPATGNPPGTTTPTGSQLPPDTSDETPPTTTTTTTTTPTTDPTCTTKPPSETPTPPSTTLPPCDPDGTSTQTPTP